MTPARTRRTPAPLLPQSLAALAFCLAAAAPAAAQQQGTPTRVRDLRGSEIEIMRREGDARRSEREKRDPGAVMAEVNEDFAALRAAVEDLKKASGAEAAVDHAAAARLSAEVKKRAARLDRKR